MRLDADQRIDAQDAVARALDLQVVVELELDGDRVLSLSQLGKPFAAAINVTMQPFRAFIGDMLPDEQRTTGFAVQTFFIGASSVVASGGRNGMG